MYLQTASWLKLTHKHVYATLQLVSMMECSRDRALAVLLSKDGDVDAAAAALLLGHAENDNC
jgi:hypothetical protein